MSLRPDLNVANVLAHLISSGSWCIIYWYICLLFLSSFFVKLKLNVNSAKCCKRTQFNILCAHRQPFQTACNYLIEWFKDAWMFPGHWAVVIVGPCTKFLYCSKFIFPVSVKHETFHVVMVSTHCSVLMLDLGVLYSNCTQSCILVSWFDYKFN